MKEILPSIITGVVTIVTALISSPILIKIYERVWGTRSGPRVDPLERLRHTEILKNIEAQIKQELNPRIIAPHRFHNGTDGLNRAHIIKTSLIDDEYNDPDVPNLMRQLQEVPIENIYRLVKPFLANNKLDYCEWDENEYNDEAAIRHKSYGVRTVCIHTIRHKGIIVGLMVLKFPKKTTLTVEQRAWLKLQCSILGPTL